MMGLKVLLYGCGAREHALAKKLLKSPLLQKLYFANTGAFCDLGEVIEFENFSDLAKKALQKEIDLLVVGPEEPLVKGICDEFLNRGIKVIGANAYWARLEGSKSFAKDFMKRNNIKTAKYKTVENVSRLEFAIKDFKAPPVIKADGLAAGKGVYLPDSFDEAIKVAKEFLGGRFNSASKKIILEQRLRGRELSVFSLWDGKYLLSFPPACDFKKLNDGDLGPNTGGMGAAFPCKLSEFENKELKKYLQKLQNALRQEKADFCGVVYSGLIIADDGVNVLEYNMRFGDPEIQAVLDNLDNDLLEIFYKMTQGKLNEIELSFKQTPSYCVVLASEGYPYCPKSGFEIKNLQSVSDKYGVEIFFAGAKKTSGKFYTSGGRVLSLVKSGDRALDDIYAAACEIEFEGKIYRRDITLR